MNTLKLSRPRWTSEEQTILVNGLENKLLLSELKILLVGRTGDAIVRQACERGYSVKTRKDGDKEFIEGIKRRGTHTRRSTKANSDQTNALIEVDDVENHQNVIVPKINKVFDGKAITITALQLLEAYNLTINSQSVKDASELILNNQMKAG